MGYRLLEHATDAIVEVTAGDLRGALAEAARAVSEITLSREAVREEGKLGITAEGKDLRYLLYSWLEELVYATITRGFAIRRVELEVSGGPGYRIDATAHGEPLDLARHGFKVEIKAPTFHDMEVRVGDGAYMRFLLDL